MRRFIVTGTDTGIGKTVFAAGLTALLDGVYWKPIQAGLEGKTDTEVVRRLGNLPAERLIPEAWRLKTPASPHYAAALEGVQIDPEALSLPQMTRPLIIEGSGGLMVPLNSRTLYIEVFARWQVPVILCARTSLGTLNHTLLSLEALRRHEIPVFGLALIGDRHPSNEQTLRELAGVRLLGRLPRIEPLTPLTLARAFMRSFSRAEFLEDASIAPTATSPAP